MELLRQLMRQVELGWAHLTACLGAPFSAPACKSLWTWTSVAAIVVGLLALWKLLAWLLKPLRLWIAEWRLRAGRREVADPDTMARYKVDDNKLFSAPGKDDVAQQIRDAIDRKKIDDKQQRHHQTLGDKKL